MPFTITSGKITGNPDDAGWAQAYEFLPEDSKKRESRGHLFAVISTATRNEGMNSVLAGREILSRLHEEYFGSEDQKAYIALKSAVQKVITEFLDWEDVEIACIAFLSDAIYLVAGGGAQIVLYRDGTLTTLIRSQKEAVTSASGIPQESDIFIIGSGAFFRCFSFGVLKGAIQGKDLNSCCEALAPTLHAQERVGNAGALFLKSEKEEQLPDAAFESEEPYKEKAEQTITEVKKPEFYEQKQEISPIKSKRRLLDFIKQIKERKVYVHEEQKVEEVSSSKKRVSASVGALLLLLLIVSITFGIKQKNEKDVKARYEEALTSASHQLTEAEELYQLNPERSRELVLGAREKVLGLSTEGVDDSYLNDLKQKIADNEKRILGEYKTNPQSFVELSLLSEGFQGNEIVMSQDIIYIVDKNVKRIISVVLSSKRSEVVAGPHVIDGIDNIAAYSGKVYVANEDGVFLVGDDGREKKIEREWLSGILPYAYAGNFYILDKGSSTIYRYSGVDGEFGSKRDWFSPGVTTDISDAVMWVIDGAVWVLTEEGEILKFSFGNPQPFRISGVYPNPEKIKAIYTDDETEDLYLLDPEKERVVVTDKNGAYKAQYVSPEIRKATQLVVSEKEKKVILLAEDGLLSIQLEHF